MNAFGPVLALFAGLAAGSIHVVSGPDHLAALAPLAVSDQRAALRTGAAWGAGHGFGVILLGIVGMALSSRVDLEAVSGWAELAVGVILVAMGLWALRRASAIVVHAHGHAHGDENHEHFHLHPTNATHDPSTHSHTHKALGVGMLHGAAGAGHLFGVIPALALSTGAAATYLLSYLVGAILTMAAFAWLLGRVFARRSPATLRWAIRATGLVAIAVGCAWIGTSVRLL